ncbi:putative trafficking protein particle complex subunit 1 [Apostichopus japonicus]|uniref:Trafficking protein particle complex subunit n=1 Tax=Stichopus japonicus TaxID=307972 RepID=A0A2G8KKU6_STIJA|nr:putative trafficking protein particle complex subunit 1 [Apostichopus japonicus]
MTIYNMYIFDRNGTCLFYQEWQRNKSSGMPQEEEFKLMYGLIFSIKSFVSRMSPVDFKDGFTNFNTNFYKLHFFEPPSGLKFVLNTSLNVESLRESLQYTYNSIYVEYVVKNPLCSLNAPIKSELFKEKLDTYIRGLPAF